MMLSLTRTYTLAASGLTPGQKLDYVLETVFDDGTGEAPGTNTGRTVKSDGTIAVALIDADIWTTVAAESKHGKLRAWFISSGGQASDPPLNDEVIELLI